MATKIKAIIPAVPISQLTTLNGGTARDDGQQLIRQSVRKYSASRPKFSFRPKRCALPKFKKSRTANNQISTSSQQPAWDVFTQSDVTSVAETGKKLKKTKKRRISLKFVTRAGQRIEWLLKKGAKYFGYAVIKVFNQPGIYTEESRTCVC